MRSDKLKRNITPYLFVLPYFSLFAIFVAVPVVIAVILSFTNFNAIQFPDFVGIKNYIELFLQDEVFIRYVIPNTIVFAVIVGPGGYVLSFLLAWALSQVTKGPRTIMALIIYSPSMTAGTTMAVIWKVLFSGDQLGYINNLLMQLGIITEPIIFLQSSDWLLPVMIIVALWSSMGVGFLSMLAGLLNIDPSLYEAAHIDGIRNRVQEVFYITIPSIKPQMLFGAIMAIVNAFKQSAIGVQLSGANPTPNYAGQLMVNHISDFGFTRYEMGYACAVSVVLLIIIWVFSKGARTLFKED
ncbi:MAG: sugar ABC transporter permease [Clostridia bacterium]|nr:sugar ABC transporter permease [Oscillospiraceae bacterium]MBP3600351.1 sugar ABC transporter permease [Clostridia bacterium]